MLTLVINWGKWISLSINSSKHICSLFVFFFLSLLNLLFPIGPWDLKNASFSIQELWWLLCLSYTFFKFADKVKYGILCSLISCLAHNVLNYIKQDMDKLQEPEQTGSLIVLYNCKHSTSALIHHLLYSSNKIVCVFLSQIFKY